MSRTLTQTVTRVLCTVALLGTVAVATTACGRYGPPQPYPPDYEAPEDDEENS